MSPKKKKEETKPKPIDLKLTLENFGPLRKAEVELKPMTIFIGPNNSGKSYTATMIYALLRSVERAHLRPADPVRSFQSWESDARAVNTAWKSLARLCENGPPSELDEGTVAELAQVFAKPLGEELKREIGRCWPPAGGQLNRAGTEHFRLDVRSEPLSFVYPQHSNALQIRPPQGPVRAPERMMELLGPLTRGASPMPGDMDRYMHLADIGSAMLFSAFDRAAYYIPASRVGILRTYRAMTASALDRLEWNGHSQPGAHLAGVDLDLHRHLSDLPQTPGPEPFPRIAAEMARELIGGEVSLMWIDKGLPPNILIRVGGREIGDDIKIERASSGDCSLIPIMLFNLFRLRQGDLLIIDEPEAHLHPGNQSILAKYLVRLVRAGVNLIITTHSEYLLSRLSNFVMLEGIKKDRRKELGAAFGFGEDDYLAKEEVGVYRFKYDRRSKAYITAPEEPTIEGIGQDEFGEVDSALYEEEIRLENEVVKKT